MTILLSFARVRDCRNSIGWEMGCTRRNSDDKAASPALLARCVNRSPVQFHQFLYQRETNAGAFVCPSRRTFDAMEAFKQISHFASSDSYSRIVNAQLGCAVRFPQTE